MDTDNAIASHGDFFWVHDDFRLFQKRFRRAEEETAFFAFSYAIYTRSVFCDEEVTHTHMCRSVIRLQTIKIVADDVLFHPVIIRVMLDGKACSITGNAFYQRSSFFVSLAFCDVIRIDVLDIDSRIGKDWFLFFFGLCLLHSTIRRYRCRSSTYH